MCSTYWLRRMIRRLKTLQSLSITCGKRCVRSSHSATFTLTGVQKTGESPGDPLTPRKKKAAEPKDIAPAKKTAQPARPQDIALVKKTAQPARP